MLYFDINRLKVAICIIVRDKRFLYTLQTKYRLVADWLAGDFQVKRIVCKRLASLLCFKHKTTEPSYADIRVNDVEDGADLASLVNHSRERCIPTLTESSSDPVLISIRDLLQKRSRDADEERARAKQEAKLRHDWMLAAAVINRLCFVFFTVVLVAVTLTFFFMFRFHA